MPGYYVDNALNRRLGRVGMRHGTAVHSTSSSSSSSPRYYVDNALNRRLGRVGMLHGTAVHSRSSTSSSYSSPAHIYNTYNVYVNDPMVPPSGSVEYSRSSQSFYPLFPSICDVDYELNQRLRERLHIDDYVEKPSLRPTVLPARPAYDIKTPTNFESKGNLTERSNTADTKKPKNMGFKENLKGTGCVAPKADDSKKSIKVELKTEQIIAFNELILGDVIGGGGFGDVYEAVWKNQQVAVKKLRVQRVSKSKLKQFEDEVRSISALDHPNIVKFYGACIVTPNLALVMEYLSDESLYENLHVLDDVQFANKTKNQFICDCFTALKYIHSKNLVHRDLKSKNIMLCDNKSHCKLADFGLALKDHIESNSTTKQFDFAGTEKYCPKEVIDGKRLKMVELKSADVYSLALTALELLIEEEPFEECRNIREIRRAIMNDDILKTLESSDSRMVSTAKKDLLRSALSDNRPTASQFLERFKPIVAAEK